MSRWSAWAVLLAVVAGLALRAPKLGLRPLHNDEAVNAVKVTELWQHGRYHYDPDEYHGPTLHYATLPFLWLSGAHTPDRVSDGMLRLAPLAFGVGLILLFLLFADGLGGRAIAWAAFFTAVSPAMVFYSRYFIHEMLLVFFTALTLGACWRYTRSGRTRWAVLAGAGVGLMYATKETFVLTIAAMVVAGIATTLWGRRDARSRTTAAPSTQSGEAAALSKKRPFVVPWRDLAFAAIAAVAVWLVFFSSFFTNFGGLLDSIRTYLPWLKRAGGASPHIHPWYFYFERITWFHPAKSPVWSEAPIVALAMVGCAVCLFGKRSLLHRFLAIYTVVLTALYCAISYKTPWCLLSFFHGMILLAGVGAAFLVGYFSRRAVRVLVAVVIGLSMVQLAEQACRANFRFPNGDVSRVPWCADRRNPYVYAQTVPNIRKLVERAEAIAQVAPTGDKTVVKVIAPGNEYWPLPWYLRRFKHVGWYERVPNDPFAPIVLVSAQVNARLDDKSDKKWLMVGMFELRPRVFFEMYVEIELWKKFVETLPRDRDE